MSVEQNPAREFNELRRLLKERLLSFCNARLRRERVNQCLRLYNDMKNFFIYIKGKGDPEYIKLYIMNVNPIIRFVLLKNEKNTFKTYFRILWHYVKFLIINKKYVFDVDADILSKYFSLGLQSTYKENNTLALFSRVIRIFYNHYGSENIVKILKGFKFKEKLKFKVDLTDEEYEKIFNAVDDLRVKLALELIAGSGLRPAEALGITWSDVDMDTNPWTVHVRHIPNSRYGAKGESNERYVPITSRASKLIEYLRKSYIKKYSTDPMKFDAYKRIINISYRTLVRKFNKAVEKAGIKKKYPLTPHKLRHYFGHRWMRINRDAIKLKTIMGHSKFEYTLIYTNPTEKEILGSFKEVDRE